jgi:hypothetical protein
MPKNGLQVRLAHAHHVLNEVPACPPYIGRAPTIAECHYHVPPASPSALAPYQPHLCHLRYSLLPSSLCARAWMLSTTMVMSRASSDRWPSSRPFRAPGRASKLLQPAVLLATSS